jgi:hypothetical protein
MSSMDSKGFHVCHIFIKENNKIVCKKCGKIEQIILSWSDFRLPPINLWSLPN